MIELNDYKLTQIDILRHGECEGGDIFRGSTDVSLTSVGMQNMVNTCAELGEQWQQIISSPMQRCRCFAEQLSDQQQRPLTIDDRLAEIRFGRWEGRLRSEIWETEGADIQQWLEDPSAFTPDGGEPLTAVSERVMAAFHAVSEAFCHQKILLVTHGGVIRVLLAGLLNMPLTHVSHFEVPYASLSRLKIYQQNDSRLVKLVAHNFVGHKV